MDFLTLAAYAAVAYLIGALPSAYVAGRAWHGTDIRACGNGNVGTVNAFRSFGPRTGAIVLLADTAKGAVDILLARFLEFDIAGMFVGAMAATVGHNWPVYLGWKGGKGVAVVFGISLGVMPVLSLFALPFVAVVYAGVRSWVWALGAGLIALNALIIAIGAPGVDVALCLTLSAVVIATHFSREWRDLREALGTRDWRKFGMLE